MGIVGFGAALEIIHEIGVPEIKREILGLTDLLIELVRKKGYTVMSPLNPDERSGIVSFKSEKRDSKELENILKTEKIVVAVRAGALRVSPHFYNTEEEIQRLVEVLPNA